MSLITRCPACGTMFKVVADQLKVSQGWVRCGQCSDVFDASAHLLPRETPWQPAPRLASSPSSSFPLSSAPDSLAATAASVTHAAAVPSAADAAPTSSPTVFVADVRTGSDAASDAAPVPTASAASVMGAGADEAAGVDDASGFQPSGWARSQPPGSPSGIDSAAGDSRPPPRPALMRTAAAADDVDVTHDVQGFRARRDSGFDNSAFAAPRHGPASLSDDSDNEEDADEASTGDVSFVREARRKAFWRRPLVRALLGLTGLALLLGLGLQGVLYQRDNIAAMRPEALPLLRALCEPLRCEIRPPRHIEAMVVDGATFTRIGPEAYRLAFTLKNNSPVQVQTPSLELTLTDVQDRAVLRRVLAPAQFGAASSLMAAQSDMAGLVNVQVLGGEAPGAAPPGAEPAAAPRVAGYRVLAFYPD